MRRLFEKTRAKIERNASVASERFAPAMQKIFSIASEIDSTSFVPKRDGFAYTAEAFKTHRETHRTKIVQPVIDVKIEEASRIVNRVNISVVRSYKVLGRGKSSKDDEILADSAREGEFGGLNPEADDIDFNTTPEKAEEGKNVVNDESSVNPLFLAPSSTPSFSLAEEASKMRTQEKTRKVLEREKNRLGHFSRFCDLIVTSQLAENVIKVSEAVLNEINSVKPESENKDGVFVVEAVFPSGATGSDTALAPEFNTLMKNIENSLRSQSLQLVNTVLRILSATTSTFPSDADVPFLTQTFAAPKIVQESSRASGALNSTRHKLQEDFNKATEYCSMPQFVNARAIFYFGDKNPCRELVEENKNSPFSAEDFASALTVVS